MSLLDYMPSLSTGATVAQLCSTDHCCRGRSKPGCRIVRSATKMQMDAGNDGPSKLKCMKLLDMKIQNMN